jgi:hypothetical protein
MRLDGFFQNAYIVRDLDRACETFRDRHGVPAFITFDLEVDARTIWGEGRQHIRAGLGWIGNLQIELIQPVSGLTRLYGDLPTDDSPRFHHIGMRVMDWDKAHAEIEANGWPIVSEGAVEGCSYVYLDARDTIGHYVEYVWMTPEFWTATGGPDVGTV